MANPSKNKGTYAETAVKRYAQANGFPDAERIALAGANDEGDVRLNKYVIVEVKGGAAAETASDGQIRQWLKDTEIERRNAAAKVGLLVTKKKRVSGANADKWYCHMTLGTLRRIAYDGYEADGYESLIYLTTTVAEALTLLRLHGWTDPKGTQ